MKVETKCKLRKIKYVVNEVFVKVATALTIVIMLLGLSAICIWLVQLIGRMLGVM